MYTINGYPSQTLERSLMLNPSSIPTDIKFETILVNNLMIYTRVPDTFTLIIDF